MKKVIGWILYSITIVALIVWVLNANSVISSVGGYKQAKAADLSQYPSHDYVYCHLDNISTMDDFLEQADFYGWAFVETSFNNPDKSITILLHNEDGCYAIQEEEVKGRASIIAAHGDIKYPNGNVSFQNVYSLVNVPDGIYDISIYCRENEHNYGLGTTYFQLEKKSGKVYMHQWSTQMIEKQMKATVEETCMSSIDALTIENNSVSVRGWAFADGHDATNQKVYFRFVNDTGEELLFPTRQIARNGVANAYGAQYLNSGYFTSFDTELLPDGVWSTSIFVEVDNNVYQSDERVYLKENNTLTQTQWHATRLSPPLMITSPEICASSIDCVEYSGEYIVSWGWALVDGHSCDQQKVYLQFENDQGKQLQYICKPMARESVAEVFGDVKYTNAGYSTYVLASDLDNGKWKVSVLVEIDGQVYASQPRQFVKEDETILLQ